MVYHMSNQFITMDILILFIHSRRTCAIILASSGQSHIEVVRSWRLNERHYGMLQGHKKSCPKLAKAFGEDTLMEWRKSYHTSPPSIDDEDAMRKLGREGRSTSTSLMDPRYVETGPYDAHRNRYEGKSMQLCCLIATRLNRTLYSHVKNGKVRLV